jgi:glycosyltransferase involved in cell wall biosynthesis
MNESSHPVVDAAVAAFISEYGSGPGRPLCVVIAALNEVGAVGGVIESLPANAAGLDLECIVVDDGSSDGTADAARREGAMVCRFDRNLGQGWALRAGYRLAADRGATVIATMDADGQFDAGELGRIAGPVAGGTADMVVGSRRLGHSEVGDRVRATGVVAFARLITLLSGQRVTDPSSGYRAFRPEVPQRVPLRQVQYQASELLIGAISLGFRVTEVPMTLRDRVAGQSKKGTNLLYGWRFTKVVIATWWRMRRAARSQPGR